MNETQTLKPATEICEQASKQPAKTRLIQILEPPRKIWAIFQNKDFSEWRNRVDVIGLDASGTARLYCFQDDGSLTDPTQYRGFLHFDFDDDDE